MSKAADNEKILKIELKDLGINLQGKKSFSEKASLQEKIVISVDESLHDGDRHVLIEIDSFNMAKVVVGQYTILNSLLKNKKDNEKYIFVVVHCYKDYNPSRTKKYLDYINRTVLNDEGIPYKIYTKEEFVDICAKAKNNSDLINKLYKEVKG